RRHEPCVTGGVVMRDPDEDDEAWPIQLADGLATDNNSRLAHPLHDRTHRCIVPRARPDADHRPNKPRFFFCCAALAAVGRGGVAVPGPWPALGRGLLGAGSSSKPRLDNSRSNEAVSARSRCANGWNADSYSGSGVSAAASSPSCDNVSEPVRLKSESIAFADASCAGSRDGADACTIIWLTAAIRVASASAASRCCCSAAWAATAAAS